MLRKHVPQPVKQHPRCADRIVGVHVVPALHLCRLHLAHQHPPRCKVLLQLCKAGVLFTTQIPCGRAQTRVSYYE